MDAGPRLSDHIHWVGADPGIRDCGHGLDTGVGQRSCAGELWVTALLVASVCVCLSMPKCLCGSETLLSMAG